MIGHDDYSEWEVKETWGEGEGEGEGGGEGEGEGEGEGGIRISTKPQFAFSN